MEQLTMKLETILEVVRVKQEVMERPVEYRTGMISSSYAGNFGIKEIGDEASEVVLVVVLMCMTIYGVKCNIPKEEVKADMIEKFEELKNVEHSNELCEDDLYTALEVYEREFYNFTIDDIEKLTDIRIERNKRNYRPQEQHIRVMNAIRDTIYPNGEWRNKEGRPKGSGTKEEVVKDWREKNPEGRKVDCRRETKLDPKTIRKWW